MDFPIIKTPFSAMKQYSVFVPNALAGRKDQRKDAVAFVAPYTEMTGRWTRKALKLDAQGRAVISYYQRSYIVERVPGSVWFVAKETV